MLSRTKNSPQEKATSWCQYELAELDVKRRNILVEVTCIEIPTKELDKYGLDLKAHITALLSKSPGFSFGVGSALSLKSLMENENVKVIASTPEILTTDGEEATVRIGEDIHYMEKGENDLFRLKTVPHAETSLTVTPNIKPENTIMLDLHFRMRSFSERVKVPEARTSIVVKDGEPAVIGGLAKSGRTETAAKDAIPETISLLFFTAKIID